MNSSSSNTRVLSLSVAISYSLLSIALILPVYYQYSLIHPGYFNFYSAMSADLPGITQGMLRAYKTSFIFPVIVLVFATWFYLKNKRSGLNITLLAMLNISLLLCLAWREFAMYALQLPAFEIIRVQ